MTNRRAHDDGRVRGQAYDSKAERHVARHRSAGVLLGTFLIVSAAVGVSEGRAEDDYMAMTPAQLKSNIESSHPAAYYILASKLFAAGARDEAVFWFYAGQLRYRFHTGSVDHRLARRDLL